MAEDAAPFVIAGAGIAGLALATALHRDGRSCVLLDERPALGSTGGAITLWPNALAALDALGVGDDVRRAGNAVSSGGLSSPSGRVWQGAEPARVERALGGHLVAIRRGVLLEILHEGCATDAVHLGRAVTGFQEGRDDVRVALADGSVVTGSALVGADGFRSAVARALDGPLDERYAGYPAWRGIAPVTGLDPAELLGRRQEFGIVPLGESGTYWFATLHEPADGARPGGELPHLRGAFARWPEPIGSLLAATPEEAVTRNDIVDRASPRNWCRGRAAVIGDAAHPMRPHLGQGGCQALVDAAVLANRLRSAPDAASAFTAYVQARRRTALRVTRQSRLVGQLLNFPVPVHRALPLLPDAVFLRRLAAVGGRDAYRP